MLARPSSVNMSTPHNSANEGQFAKTVLMPGDPLRAKFIAENFFDNAVQVNAVRGMLGYTGTYNGAPISVMASGMGIPSIGIYAYELYNFYGVENIIRVGSAGAIATDLKLRDVVIGIGACTNSNFAAQYGLPGTFAPTASYSLLSGVVENAKRLEIPVKVGNLLSSDTFYDDSNSLIQWQKMGVLAVEMESAGLYYTAARANKNALCICTISDCPLTGESCSAQEREQTFESMIRLAASVVK